MLFRTLIPALAAAAVLLPAAAAEAKTYCVHYDVVSCPAGTTSVGVDIQDGLDAAKGNPGADTVRIMGGNYPTDADGFDVAAGEVVTIDGSGATVQASELVAGEVALDARAATVHGLRFQLVDGVYRTGIRSGGGTVTDVFVGGSGSEQRGAQLGGGAKATRLDVDLDGTSAVGVADTGTAAAVEASTLDAATAVWSSGPMTSVRRSVLKGSATTNGRLVVEDSIVRPRDGATGLTVICATDSVLVAKHVTVTGTAAATAGAGLSCPSSGTGRLDLRDSILATPKSVRVSEYGGAVRLDAVRSALDPAAFDVKAGQADTALTGTLPVPQFASPAKPELPDGSPLIDAADPATATAKDQLGRARPADGDGDGVALPDVGALEHPAVPLKPQAPVTPEPPSTPATAAAETTPATLPVPAVPAPPRTAPSTAPDLARTLRRILAGRNVARTGARYSNLAGAKLTITWKIGRRVVAKGSATGKGVRLEPRRLRKGAKVTVSGTLVKDGRTVAARLVKRAR